MLPGVSGAHERYCSEPGNLQHLVNGCYSLDFIVSGRLDANLLGYTTYQDMVLRTYVNPNSMRQEMYMCPDANIPAENLGDMCESPREIDIHPQ